MCQLPRRRLAVGRQFTLVLADVGTWIRVLKAVAIKHRVAGTAHRRIEVLRRQLFARTHIAYRLCCRRSQRSYWYVECVQETGRLIG